MSADGGIEYRNLPNTGPWAGRTIALTRIQAKRFWLHVEKRDGCWTWTGAMRGGYGAYLVGRLARAAHRVAWTIACGAIPAGTCVLHSCDNTRCVNPEHLWLGSQIDNVRDREEKGRGLKGRQRSIRQ